MRWIDVIVSATGLGLIVLFGRQAAGSECLDSAPQVRERHPGAWPSWHLRNSRKCWYAIGGHSVRTAAVRSTTPSASRPPPPPQHPTFPDWQAQPIPLATAHYSHVIYWAMTDELNHDWGSMFVRREAAARAQRTALERSVALAATMMGAR